jgi:signal transduction histidine kinase
MDLGGHDDTARDGDWAVPATALAHALRTPLNALKGWATLLASGELGRLPPDAATATSEMRRAVGELERAIELVGPLARPAPDTQVEVELADVIDGVLTSLGYRARGPATLTMVAPAWKGWRPLFAALGERCAADGAERVRVTAAAGAVWLEAAAPRAGAGDGQLAAVAAARRAAAGGRERDFPPGGGARLVGAGLICGSGRTTYRCEQARREG